MDLEPKTRAQLESELESLRERLAELQALESEHKRSEAELLQQSKDAAEAANRANGVFLAKMSHELRTPLNAILGFAEIMERDAVLEPEQRENLAIILRSGRRLLALLNDVLEMARIEAGRIALREETFDLWQLLEDLRKMFGPLARSKGLVLDLKIDTLKPRFLRADEGKLCQVLTNMLSNAVKFTHEGQVSLQVKHLENSGGSYLIQFKVTDTGAGISQEDMAGLFEPFVQTASGRESGEGTGLGLSISRQFVQLMGGDLIARSQPDVGSTFLFTIPVEIGEPPPETSEPGDNSSRSGNNLVRDRSNPEL